MKPTQAKISENLSVRIFSNNRVEVIHKNGTQISLTHEELRDIIGVHTRHMRDTDQLFIVEDDSPA